MPDQRLDHDAAHLRDLLAAASALVGTEPAAALAAAEKAREVAERVEDRSALASSLYIIGESELANGSYAEAVTALTRALELARSMADRPFMVQILRALLKCDVYTRKPDTALVRGMQALQLARDLDDRATEALAHNDLGLVCGRLGDLEGALEHLLAGLRILQDDGSPKLGRLLNNIGNVYLELGDDAEALGFFERARESLRLEGAVQAEAIAIGNVGRACEGLGRLEEALAAFESSAGRHQENGDLAYLPPAMARVASALAAVGRDDEARVKFGQAFEILARSQHREFEDEVLTAAGRFHLLRKEPDRAIALLDEALAIVPADETTRRAYELHEALAGAFEQLANFEGALRHYKAYHRIRQAVSDSSTTARIKSLMLDFDVERARQQEEILRLRNVELARANEELQALHVRLEEKNRELHQISIEDSLTGLYNRRHLDVQLGVEISRARRQHRPMCVAMCDIDHFKDVNDRHSHALGDDVLRAIADVLRETARLTDVVARFGGEEFFLILPDTDLAGAETLSERIRLIVADYEWHRFAPGLQVTLSIGVAELQDVMDARELIAAADARLYEAKRGGRDRVVA